MHVSVVQAWEAVQVRLLSKHFEPCSASLGAVTVQEVAPVQGPVLWGEGLVLLAGAFQRHCSSSCLLSTSLHFPV